MSPEQPERPVLQAPLGQLERALIDEYVRARGYDPLTLAELPEQQREALLRDASVAITAKTSK